MAKLPVCLEQGFWSVIILLAKYLTGTYQSPPLSSSPALPNFDSTSSTSCQSIFAPTAGAAETKSVVLTVAIRHSEYSVITREQTLTIIIRVPLVQLTHSLLHRNGRIVESCRL